MTANENTPTPASENLPLDEKQNTPAPPAEQPADKPLDPKEEARRRSKADLQRNRSRLRNNRGKF